MELRGVTIGETKYCSFLASKNDCKIKKDEAWYNCSLYLIPVFPFPVLKKQALYIAFMPLVWDIYKQDLGVVGKTVFLQMKEAAYPVLSLSSDEAFPARKIGITPNIHYCWQCEIDVNTEQLLTHDDPVFREYATRLVAKGL